MSRIRTRIAAVTITIGLASAAVYLVERSKEPPKKVDEMFPDGLVYDFGRLRAGTQATYAFRIVNTTDVPLRIISLRTS